MNKLFESRNEVPTLYYLESSPTPICCKNLIFRLKNVFRSRLDFFLWVVYTRSGYLKDLLNLVHYDNKKISNVRHTKQIICKEKSQKLDFWKFQCQNGVGELSRYAVKTSFFDLKLFFQSLLEFFLWVVYTYSRYLKGPFSLVLHVRKKIRVIRQTYQKIFQKMR